MSDADFEIYDDENSVEQVTIGLNPGEIPDNALVSFHTPTELIYVEARDGCPYAGGHNGAAYFLGHLLSYLVKDTDLQNALKIDIVVKQRE